MRNHLTQVRMAWLQITNAGKGMERREPSYTGWWECKLLQSLWRTVQRCLRKLKIELPYDREIPHQGIYLFKTVIQKDTHTSMFIAALFIITKTWRQAKCSSTDEPIKKMWYIYAMYLGHTIQWNTTKPQKEWINAIWSNVCATRDYHTKWSKSERWVSYDIIYMWNLKYGTNELIYKTETDSQT